MAIVVFITAKNKREAKRIAKRLLKQKLAACINIVEKVNSLFWWGGKIEDVSEAFLIVKTRKSLLKKVIKAVRRVYSYQVPEIITLPIQGGFKGYLDWLLAETKGKKR